MTVTVEDLIDAGVYTVVGEEDGERILEINPERALELVPEVYWAHVREIDEAILKAIDAGYLEMDFDLDLNTTYVVTEEGQRAGL